MKKRDNGLQSKVKIRSNDISMMTAFASQSLGPPVDQSRKKAPLETNDVEAEASVGQLGHVQAPLKQTQRVKTKQMSGEKNTNQMPFLVKREVHLFTNQDVGIECQMSLFSRQPDI
ncbi:hypothetical protein FQN60_016705 [Etheostoma spectabile]|uniref:Uncharacterized protein n=1 Tax=Etheostoma spectabile TaxID=54343 RepID=A0A5J5D407_9PERO|nr:hypothetical protein FQN60_016705 [Etheostoma spectabile]